MRIERLVLENHRGFQALDLTFHPRLNVLIGGNGAGKSTILGALRPAIGERSWGPRVLDPSTAFDEIRRGAESCAVAIHVAGPTPRVLRVVFRLRGECVGEWQAAPPTFAIGLFLPPNRFRPRGNDRRVGAVDVLGETQVARFDGFVAWFRQAENRENEIRLSAAGQEGYRHPALQAVRRALDSVVSRLTSTKYARVRMTRVGENVPPEGALVIDKGSETLPVDQLSEGESTMLLMVGDIAHHLAVACPELDDPLHGAGVVLIDAIELHLHPSWQRAILPALVETFPNVQFIVTTHSPQVIGEVPRESVICLRDFRVVPTPPTFGRDSNSILEEVMGASSRDESVKHALGEIAALIDSDALAAARARIDALAESLGPDDPELAGSRAAIAFLEDA